MRQCVLLLLLWGTTLPVTTWAASKPHVITFGKWLPVKVFAGSSDDQSLDIKVRSLSVDGRLREFTTGDPHDITDRLFVVRRSYRVNDALPSDPRTPPRWVWQRGGWLLVDRLSGHISALALPEFDSFFSQTAWFRDYAAYCGLSDDGTKLSAVVFQVGRRRPVLKKSLGPAKEGDTPDAVCAVPAWQRRPTRVTFQPTGGKPISFEIHERAADLIVEPEATEEETRTQ